MGNFKTTITFEAKDENEAMAVTHSINTILANIKDKKHLIELAKIVVKKPNLIEKGIPLMKLL